MCRYCASAASLVRFESPNICVNLTTKKRYFSVPAVLALRRQVTHGVGCPLPD